MRGCFRTTGSAALALVALTACGSENPSGGSTPEGTSPTTSTTTTLPLTITRQGGVAGFNDRIVVGPDGIAEVYRQGAVERCRVEDDLFATLAAAAANVTWSDLEAKPPTAQHPDDMVVAVTAQDHSARIEDPRVDPLESPVTELLADTTASPTARKLCRPV